MYVMYAMYSIEILHKLTIVEPFLYHHCYYLHFF